MNRISFRPKVSSDGTLHFSLPLGIAEADHEVRGTVEPLICYEEVRMTTTNPFRPARNQDASAMMRGFRYQIDNSLMR